MITNQSLPQELESTAVIRFQDCDPYGHLNNARYIDYFMNARQDQVAEAYDFHIFEYGRQTNQGWVVSKTQIAYLAPAMLMENVRIRTRLIHLSESGIVVEGIMLNADGSRVKAVSWVEFTFVSLVTGRPAHHPADLMALFQSVLADHNFSEEGFSQRIQAVKSHYRRRPVAANPTLTAAPTPASYPPQPHS
jgi:acyl-CoA thioester hydrolase